MSSRDIKIAKKDAKETRRNSEMMGKYATIEQAIEAKEAALQKVIPELDLSILIERIRQ